MLLSATYSELFRGRVWHLFIFIAHLYIRELPTKYPREKILDPRNTHEKKFTTYEIPTRRNFGPRMAQWHDDTRPTKPTMAEDPRNLTHSLKSKSRAELA